MSGASPTCHWLVWAADAARTQSEVTLASLPGDSAACRKTVTFDHLAYTLERIANATVADYPYPHLVIQDVFEPRLYQCMLQELPKKNAGYKRLFPGVERYEIALSRKVPDPKKAKKGKVAALPDPGPFWKSFSQVFGSRAITSAYLRKLHATVALRDPHIFSYQKRLYWNMALSRDMTGYAIGPHTDSRGKVVTVLYYLPKNNSAPKDAGTCVVCPYVSTRHTPTP
eukprot:gene6694-8013_t